MSHDTTGKVVLTNCIKYAADNFKSLISFSLLLPQRIGVATEDLEENMVGIWKFGVWMR